MYAYKMGAFGQKGKTKQKKTKQATEKGDMESGRKAICLLVAVMVILQTMASSHEDLNPADSAVVLAASNIGTHRRLLMRNVVQHSILQACNGTCFFDVCSNRFDQCLFGCCRP
jgi:hypothetical protein